MNKIILKILKKDEEMKLRVSFDVKVCMCVCTEFLSQSGTEHEASLSW